MHTSLATATPWLEGRSATASEDPTGTETPNVPHPAVTVARSLLTDTPPKTAAIGPTI
jgi:hypothetical protein